MAVKFLDNLDLNDNQLLNARLENLASDPGSANAGDIIYNTTSNVFKFYNGSAWVDPSSGGYTSWTAIADSGSNHTVADGQSVDWAGGDGITTANSTPSGQRTITITNSDKGSSQNIFKTIAVSGQSNIVADSNSDTLTVVAGTGIVATTDASTDSLTLATDLEELPQLTPAGNSNDSLVYLNDGSDQAHAAIDQFPINEFGAANGTLNMGNQQITSLATPTGTTDAATKAYVDSAVVGNLIFQGGYNAATNTPDLDSSPSSSIKKGWSYVVTAAGTFFTETVEVGDFLIAQQDAPTTLAHWVTVQNNIGLATTTTVGIASFAAANFAVSGAGEVTLADTAVTGGSYGSSSAVPAITVNDKGQITEAADQTISITSSNISNFNTAVDARITAREFAGLNSSAGTSHTITHDLGTRDVMVDIYDASTYETVYAKVVRTSTSVVTVTTSASIASESIMVLVKSIDA